MQNGQDWIWEILVCPECGNSLFPGENPHKIVCNNNLCGYNSNRSGRVFNLLPFELDSFELAEHEFRKRLMKEKSEEFKSLPMKNQELLSLFNLLTGYPFSSQYLFFRDIFTKRNFLEGRGLEIGGATGHISGFIKLFFPKSEMITSDIAPINIDFAYTLSESLDVDIDYFILANAEKLPFQPDSFDFLFCSALLHHVGNLDSALQKGRSILKPEGKWYIINELSIGPLPRAFWNSQWGEKGKMTNLTGIREKSYTLKEWKQKFRSNGFKIIDVYFHRNPEHKLRNWSRSAYYAAISKLPISILKIGIPCEVCFVLQKS